MKWFIDYKTGITKEVEGTLEKAFSVAEEGMAYTQQSVTIKSEDDSDVYISRWWGMPPEETEPILFGFGDYGFYSPWKKEV